VDAVRIVNHSRLSQDALAAHVEAPVGQPLDPGRLEEGLNHIFGLELFDSVYYDIARGSRGNELTVTARERAWGPDSRCADPSCAHTKAVEESAPATAFEWHVAQ
jgi:NTE family protein